MVQQATITELTLLVTVVLSVLTLVVPHRYILLVYVVGACWVPADQTIMVGELNFQVLRVLAVMGILRLFLRGEVVPIRWNKLDKLFLAWAIVGTIIYVLQWMSMAAIIYKCGRLLESLGLYWVFRQCVRSWGDVKRTYVGLAICAIAMVPFVVGEWSTGSNPFTSLGRVTTFLREGNFRCQATFPHAIMMGLFWATLVPLFVGFAMQKIHRLLFWAAVAASTFLVFASASSTPVLTLAGVVAVLAVYRWRRLAPLAAWAFVAMLVALHTVMTAPVWHLLGRISPVRGSTGWHRFHLIDGAVRYFTEWMLLGTRSTGHWGWGLEDVTNQYILEGVRGGVITLVLFCAVLYVGAKVLWRLSMESREPGESYLAWCTFTTIIAHCVSFIGVSYFGQITMIWYLLLASVGLFYGKVDERRVAGRPVMAGRLQQA